MPTNRTSGLARMRSGCYNQRWEGARMAQTIEAVYEQGVFKPLETVELPEGQKVALSVEPLALPTGSEAELPGISADRARDIVDYFLANEVGNLLTAGDPRMV